MFKNLRRKLAELLTPDVQGEVQHHRHGPWQISDGIDYTLPVPIPASIREAGREDVYLEEVSTVFKHQFDTPYQTHVPWQRLSVSTPLVEWDWMTRRNVLERTHLIWERDPLANTAVSYNRLFAVGKGMSISYENQEVKAVLEKFINNPENAVREQEKTLLDTLQVDGELFIRFFEQGGETVIAPLMPWGVKWIKHEVGFIRRVQEYQYQVAQDDGAGQNSTAEPEDIPAEEVLHVAINRLPYEQRGRPELFRIIPWLRAYKEWLENRARQNHYRNALLFDVTLHGATAGQVRAKRNQYKEPPSQGSLSIHNDKEEWKMHSAAVGANDASEDGRQMKMQIAAGARMAEYFLADGSNANLASATAQQLPALKSFGEWQDIMAEQVWVPIFKRVIKAAVEAQDLPEIVEVQDSEGKPVEDSEGQPVDPIPAEEAFSVTYAPLEEDDPKTLVEALTMAANASWLSDQTATSLLPWTVDYHVEQKRIAAERQQMMDQMVQGQLPFPFGPNGQPEEEPESQDEPQES